MGVEEVGSLFATIEGVFGHFGLREHGAPGSLKTE